LFDVVRDKRSVKVITALVENQKNLAKAKKKEE
jgi:hypothetical protein